MEKLKICWWNTGLAPPSGASNDSEHLAKVVDHISRLVHRENVDLLCLGEVDELCMNQIRKELSRPGVAVVSRAKDDSGTAFNMGFVYKSVDAFLGPPSFHSTIIEGASKKMAQSFQLAFAKAPPITFFVVHWPSRIYVPPEAALRTHIGQALRNLINQIYADSTNRNVIVLGDFNDEPYNDSVARYLYSTRDAMMARKYPNLLYNPFWSLLPSSFKYSFGSTIGSSHGSYYFNADKSQRWRVYDQILFSSDFLGSGEWHLNENEPFISFDAEVYEVGPSKSKLVDHLPVFSVLEREP